MAFFRGILKKLLGEPTSAETQSAPFIATEQAQRLGYHSTPGGWQWSPSAARPVDKSRWKPCDGCGRLIPIEKDFVLRLVDEPFRDRRAVDPDATLVEDSVTRLTEVAEPAGTFTYVCPYCRHCHVGTPSNSADDRSQSECHECGESLGAAFQCPKCSFPRGWMTVRCPNCRNRQPVSVPHWVAHCDMFHLECVRCECTFDSGCIC
jgi:hypothetical protein